jgi:hypothetical protein
MSLPLVINGVTFNYPQVDDSDWGVAATDWAAAVTVGMLQKAGGLFQLQAELDFGTAFGVKSLYLKSRTTGVADAGQIRLARADVINWRNNAGDGNLSLGVSASNVLQFDGADIQGAITVSDTTTIDLTFVANALSADIVALSIANAQISNSAAIAYSKLALTGSILNADINAAAAIAYSKLALSNSIVNADINASAAIAYTKLALSNTIVNADINSAAAIAYSKLALTGSILNADINAAAAIAYSKLNLTGSILNADINAAAAIAYSKLNLTGNIVNADISASAAIAYSKLALTGSIVNADVNASAAIAYSKLALSDSIVNADINSAAAIAYSKLALTGAIVNADINASAAIAFSKLAALASANILVGSAGNVATSVAVTGDVTISNAGVTAIGANKVANSQLAQMAQSTFKGRAAAAGTGDPVDLTATQATAILNNMVGDSGSGGTKGLVPAPASGDAAASKFLKADGTWAAPAGAGDVVGPASSTDGGFAKFNGTTGKLLKDSAATISNSDVASNAAIAFSKLATLTAAHILVGSAGNVATDVAVTGDISLTNAGVTAYSGTVPVNKGGTNQTSFTDGQLMIGNTSGNTLTKATLTAGTNVTITNGNGSISIAASSTAIPAWTYVGQSSTLNPAALGSFYKFTGASFTTTLPTAASVAGQGFVFVHAGTSLTQVYTFNTTSSQTIGGVASGSYALYTSGETLYLVSDGSNWIIQQHTANTGWIDAGAMTITGTTTNPTKSNSPTTDKVLWRRQGTDAVLNYSFVASTQTGSSAGSGDYKFATPTNLTIDTTGINLYTTVVGNAAAAHPTNMVGDAWIGYTAAVGPASVSLFDSSTFRLLSNTNVGIQGALCSASSANITAATITYTINLRVPISGWQP